MVFEDFYENLFDGRRSLEDPHNKVAISRKEYEILRKIADKYEALAPEHKKVKTQKDKLLKELDDLKEDGRKLKELLEEKEKFIDSLIKVQADFENYKKVSKRENQRYKSYALEKILSKLIKHYDDLERSLKVLETFQNGESSKKGFKMMIDNFKKLLKEEGLEPMNCEGEKFDPYKHEAIMVENRENLPENTILEVLDNGYYYNSCTLRPARVKISKKPN